MLKTNTATVHEIFILEETYGKASSGISEKKSVIGEAQKNSLVLVLNIPPTRGIDKYY